MGLAGFVLPSLVTLGSMASIKLGFRAAGATAQQHNTQRQLLLAVLLSKHVALLGSCWHPRCLALVVCNL
jgi:hypothetical protein